MKIINKILLLIIEIIIFQRNIQNFCNLKLEIDKDYIYFDLTKLNQSLEYRYTNKMNLQSVLGKFDLNPSNYSNSELKIFDLIYQKNNISIQINDDNSCNLIFKIMGSLEYKEKIIEIKLFKEMNENDRFNMLYNDIMKKERIEYQKEIEKIKNRINELNINLEKREEDIKFISNQNQAIIKKIDEIILKQENEIKGNYINEIINQRINEIEKN